MTIGIIGGTGFLGRHLCEALHRRGLPAFATSRSPDVAFLDRHAPSVEAVAVDEPDLWRRIAGAEAVVHLGSTSKPRLSWRAPDQEIEMDVARTARLVRQILDVNPGCHVVYASSGGTIYGGRHDRPIREDAPVAPTTSYALGKHLSEQTLRFFAAIEDHAITVLRIANPVGRWQSDGRHGLVAAAVHASLRAEEITVYGDGRNLRDYFDADELADLLIDVARAPKGGFRTYNVGSGRGLTERDVLDTIRTTLCTPVRAVFRPARPFDVKYAVLCADRIHADYGWRAAAPLNDIVRKLAR